MFVLHASDRTATRYVSRARVVDPQYARAVLAIRVARRIVNVGNNPDRFVARGSVKGRAKAYNRHGFVRYEEIRERARAREEKFSKACGNSRLGIGSAATGLIPTFRRVSYLTVILIVEKMLLVICVVDSCYRSRVRAIVSIRQCIRVVLVGSTSFLKIGLDVESVNDRQPMGISAPLIFTIFVRRVTLPTRCKGPARVLIAGDFATFGVFAIFRSVHLVDRLVNLNCGSVAEYYVRRSLRTRVLVRQLQFIVIRSRIRVPREHLVACL